MIVKKFIGVKENNHSRKTISIMQYGKINKETFNDDICVNCGGRRGIHNHMNQQCPADINSNADHTEYRDGVFKLADAPSPSLVPEGIEKKYWHEIDQSEVDKLIEEKKDNQFVLDNYLQPSWCRYPEALCGVMGCWSLVDNRPDGLRNKISIDFCTGCDCFVQPNSNQSNTQQ
jgi:hypothetical protein